MPEFTVMDALCLLLLEGVVVAGHRIVVACTLGVLLFSRPRRFPPGSRHPNC